MVNGVDREPIVLRELPTLETDRLVLRRTTVFDADRYMTMRSRICADPNAARFLSGDRPSSLEEARAKLRAIDRRFVEDNSAIPWTITLRGQDELIGIVGFARWDKKNFRSEVIYELDPLHWRHGFATEALRRVVSFGLLEMQLHRVEAHIDPENLSSVRVVERLKFEREGILRQNVFRQGKFFDTVVCATFA